MIIRQKGFTLVELLAVIVILGIIMLIVVPTMYSTISKSKTTSAELSAKFYVDAVEKAALSKETTSSSIDDGVYQIMNNGNVCLGSLSGNVCSGEILTLELNGKEPVSGSILIKNNKVLKIKNLEFDNYYANMGYDKEFSISTMKESSSICKAVTSSNKTTGNVPTGSYLTGDEYICNVDGNNEYHFFILSRDGSFINLILDRTIQKNGELSTDGSNSITAWLSSSDGSGVTYGPITAFKFLSSATSSWKNILNININYNYNNYISTGFSTNENTVSIIRDGISTSSFNNLKSRLPYEDELKNAGCTETSASCPLWISNYLNDSETILGGTSISGVYGYWVIPSSLDSNIPIIDYNGSIVSSLLYLGGAQTNSVVGVRPVISLYEIDLS